MASVAVDVSGTDIDKNALFYILFANWHSPATLTMVSPCFFLSYKANVRVYLAKTGHGPQSSQTVLFCVCFCLNVYCTVLYCIVLYCTVLYCTVLYCIVLYSTVLYCTVLYYTVMYCTVLHCNLFYCTVLYCILLYCTVLYCTIM
jgi:hypothetical protein